MTFDSATRIWWGRESIRISDLIEKKVWPANGKKDLSDQPVLLGITWKPAPGDGLSGAFTSFHISDIWLDDQSIEHAAYFQTQKNNSFIRTSISDQTPGVSTRNADFSYPYAVEHEGKLYVGYTPKSHMANELAIVPIRSLKIEP